MFEVTFLESKIEAELDPVRAQIEKGCEEGKAMPEILSNKIVDAMAPLGALLDEMREEHSYSPTLDLELLTLNS